MFSCHDSEAKMADAQTGETPILSKRQKKRQQAAARKAAAQKQQEEAAGAAMVRLRSGPVFVSCSE